MTFPQRLVNTFIAAAFTQVRNFFVFPKLEKILNEKFPDETRPTLQEIEDHAGLVLQVLSLSLEKLPYAEVTLLLHALSAQ